MYNAVPLFLILTLTLPNIILGIVTYKADTSYYTSGNTNSYDVNRNSYHQSYNVNPFSKYQQQSSPYEGQVYITDKYGHTTLSSSSSSYQNSNNLNRNYANNGRIYITDKHGHTTLLSESSSMQKAPFNYRYSRNHQLFKEYQNHPYNNQVYITDKYGHTTLADSSLIYQTFYNQNRNYGRSSKAHQELFHYWNTEEQRILDPYRDHPNNNEIYVTDKYGHTTLARSLSIHKERDSTQQAVHRKCYPRPCDIKCFDEDHMSVCTDHTCGQNAQCTIVEGRPTCSCLTGFIGNPLNMCKRLGCFDNSECNSHLSCINKKCVDPCIGCGVNATCQTQNHIPFCCCPPGYTGDPFTLCKKLDSNELCQLKSCGKNSQCEVVNETPVCKCLPGFYESSIINGCIEADEKPNPCDTNTECETKHDPTTTEVTGYYY